MTLNPQYEEIGKGFVAQYYAFFDDPDQRFNLIHLYNVSLLKFHMKKMLFFKHELKVVNRRKLICIANEIFFLLILLTSTKMPKITFPSFSPHAHFRRNNRL